MKKLSNPILGPKSHYFWQLVGKLIYKICHYGPCIFSLPLGFVYMKRYESTPFIITSTDCKTCKVFGWNKLEKLHWNMIVVPFCSFFRKIVPFLKFKHDFYEFLTVKCLKFYLFENFCFLKMLRTKSKDKFIFLVRHIFKGPFS